MTILKLCCISTVLVVASSAQALSARDTIRDWMSAAVDTRLRLAENMAATVRDLHPDVTGMYLFICINRMAEIPEIKKTAATSKIVDVAVICAAMPK